MDHESRWLRIAEAAEAAGVGRTTLHLAAVAHELPFAEIDGIRFFDREQVELWVHQRRAKRQQEVAA